MSTTLADLDKMIGMGLDPWRYDKPNGLMYFKTYNEVVFRISYGTICKGHWVKMNVDLAYEDDYFVTLEVIDQLREELWCRTTRSRTSKPY